MTIPGRLQSITSLKISPGDRPLFDGKRKVIQQYGDRQQTAMSRRSKINMSKRKNNACHIS